MITYKAKTSNPQSTTRLRLTTEASFLGSACQIRPIKNIWYFVNITQKFWATVHDTPARKIDLEKCHIYFNSTTSQFLGFFRRNILRYWKPYSKYTCNLLLESARQLAWITMNTTHSTILQHALTLSSLMCGSHVFYTPSGRSTLGGFVSSARIWKLQYGLDAVWFYGARLCLHLRLQDAIKPHSIFALVRSLRTVWENKNKTRCRTEIPPL